MQDMEEDDEDEADDEDWNSAPGMTARQRNKEVQARKARQAAEAAVEQPQPTPRKKGARAKREAEADGARGPPPEPRRSSRTPAELLPDLIMVWELLHVRSCLSPMLRPDKVDMNTWLDETSRRWMYTSNKSGQCK